MSQRAVDHRMLLCAGQQPIELKASPASEISSWESPAKYRSMNEIVRIFQLMQFPHWATTRGLPAVPAAIRALIGGRDVVVLGGHQVAGERSTTSWPFGSSHRRQVGEGPRLGAAVKRGVSAWGPWSLATTRQGGIVGLG